MSAKLSAFEPVEGLDRIACATKGTLRCTAIKLNNNKICLFSPVQGLGEAALESLKQLGNVVALLAPNHYHNKALREYAEAFPAADMITSEDAMPRLEKITGLKFDGLDVLTAELPDTVKILLPTGLKTGEVWLRVESDEAIAWVVADAFSTTKESPKAPISDTPQLLGTFPKFGVADSTIYKHWVVGQLERDTISMVVPCHGSVIKSDALNAKLLGLMQQLQ